MEVTRKSRLQLHLQSTLFIVLFLGLIATLAWLSKQYHSQADWTANNRHTLSAPSIELLKRLDGPIEITAFARDNETLRRPIQELVERYRLAKPDVKLRFVNPDTNPDQVRANNITIDGELVLRYRNKSENLRESSEQSLSNALQRLAREGAQSIVYLAGHGERSLAGRANHDLGEWGQQLQQKGFISQALNLASTPTIPADAALLIIASPQTDLLPGEVVLIGKYLDNGGNLLWLADPGSQHGLQAIAAKLGITLSAGVVVDPSSQLLGINDPRFAVVAEYPDHPITQGFKTVTLFPRAGGILMNANSGWQGQPLLSTMPRSWLETSAIDGEIGFDPAQDTQGPITLSVALSRTHGEGKDRREQRVVVVANGDWLANSFLGNGGNLDLGLNLVNWLSHDDSLLNIPARTAPDQSLNLSAAAQIALFATFLLLLPLGLLGTGGVIWFRRKRR